MPWSAAAAVPGNAQVHGALHASGGGAVADGSYQLTFRLYGAAVAGKAVWTEGPVTVSVKNGAFTYTLGASKALNPGVLAGLQGGWLGVTVAAEPELPRQALRSTLWAHKAAVAEGILCTGCVSVAAMTFDGDLDLGGNALKAKTITVGALTANTITANNFTGDGSKLTGISVPTGSCPKGQVVSGVGKDGELTCVSIASAFPPDGIDEISGDLIHNQFKDVASSPNTPLGIADNNPVGTSDVIDVPDLGLAQKLTVSIELTNSNMKAVSVYLYDAANKQYTLYDGDGSGKSLSATYPTPTKTKTGDLTTWEGKNPKGKWRLLVVDKAFLNNGKDGAIKNWSVNIQTLSSKKIQVKGSVEVKQDLAVGGLIGLGTSNLACSKKLAGALKRSSNGVQWCDGVSWRGFGGRGATYRWQVWSTYHQWSGGWMAGNSSSLFGGVNPSTWGDSNALASSLSSTTDILRTFFVRRGPEIGTIVNVNVYSYQWRSYSSTNSRHVAALFRIKNNTKSTIKWTAHWYRTGYGGWSERASIALNGSNIWNTSSDLSASSNSSHTLSIPGNRTSTAVFVSSSNSACCNEHGTQSRALFMAFYNNCLKLPNGLEFVDDLDTKPNGWNN